MWYMIAESLSNVCFIHRVMCVCVIPDYFPKMSRELDLFSSKTSINLSEEKRKWCRMSLLSARKNGHTPPRNWECGRDDRPTVRDETGWQFHYQLILLFRHMWWGGRTSTFIPSYWTFLWLNCVSSLSPSNSWIHNTKIFPFLFCHSLFLTLKQSRQECWECYSQKRDVSKRKQCS